MGSREHSGSHRLLCSISSTRRHTFSISRHTSMPVLYMLVLVPQFAGTGFRSETASDVNDPQ